MTRSLVAALTDVDRHVAITLRPLAEQVDNSLVEARIVVMLSGFFGALARLWRGWASTA